MSHSELTKIWSPEEASNAERGPANTPTPKKGLGVGPEAALIASKALSLSLPPSLSSSLPLPPFQQIKCEQDYQKQESVETRSKGVGQKRFWDPSPRQRRGTLNPTKP